MNETTTETVYVAKLYRSTHEGIYHTNEDCRSLQRSDSIAAKPRNVLSNDMQECKLCKNESQPQGIQQDKDCPFCGKTVGKLPVHLPKCENR